MTDASHYGILLFLWIVVAPTLGFYLLGRGGSSARGSRPFVYPAER